MKKHTWIPVDIAMSAAFCLTVVMSYLLEPFRVAVLVFGVLSMAMLCGGMVTYVYCLRKGRIPIALPVMFGALICLVSIYQPAGDSQLFLVVPGIAALTLAVVTVVLMYRKHAWKRAAVSFVANLVFYFFLAVAVMMFVNYSMDPSPSTQEVFCITGETGVYTRGGIGPGTAEYTVAYLGDSEKVKMDTVELSITYQFEIDDHVEVKWRKGVFEPMYRVDYTNAIRDGS